MTVKNGIKAVELLPSADPALRDAAHKRGHQAVVDVTATLGPAVKNGVEGVVFVDASDAPASHGVKRMYRLDSADPALADAARKRGQMPVVVIDASGNVVAAAPSAPVNVVAPVASGSTVQGQTLSVTDGTWTGSPAPAYTYQWKRGGVAISGATSPTYVTQVADAGASVTCTVTATNSQGSASATSNAMSIVAIDATPALSYDAPTGALQLDIEPAADVAGTVVTWQVYSDSGLSTLIDSGTHTLTSGDVAAGALTISRNMYSGTVYGRAKESVNNIWSNTLAFYGGPPIVVIAYGQSNQLFAFRGGNYTITPGSDIYVFDGHITDWDDDPAPYLNTWQPPPGPPGTLHGLANGAIHLLTQLKAHFGVPVGAVYNAKPGVDLAGYLLEGSPGESGLEFIDLAANITNSGIASAYRIYIDYHQGEGDAAGLAAGQSTWLADLSTLHGQICTVLGKSKAEVPFIVSSLARDLSAVTLGYDTPIHRAHWNTQQGLIKAVQGYGTNMHYSHSNVDAPLSEDGIHWTTVGYGNAKDRMARTIIELDNGTGKYPRWNFAPSGQIISATVTRVTMQHGLGTDLDASTQTGLTGFKVRAFGDSWVTTTGARVDATHIDLTHAALSTSTIREIAFADEVDYDVTNLPLDNSGVSGVGVPPDTTADTYITASAGTGGGQPLGLLLALTQAAVSTAGQPAGLLLSLTRAS